MKTSTTSQAASQWRGYTLEELQYERILTMTRIHIERSKLIDSVAQTRDRLPFIGRNSATSIIRSISSLEYIILAIKLFRKVAPLFSKKKK